MSFPSPASNGQLYTSGGYTYIYNNTLKIWSKTAGSSVGGVTTANGVVSTSNSTSNTSTAVSANGVATGNSTVNTAITANGVSSGNTALTGTGLSTGNSSVNTAITANGVSTGNTALTGTGVSTGNSSVNTQISANGVLTGNTALTGTGIATGNSTVNTAITANGVATGNTALTGTGVSTGNSSVNTQISANGVSTGNTAVTGTGVATGNSSSNTQITSNAVSTANSTTNTTITPGTITLGSATINSTSFTGTSNNALTANNANNLGDQPPSYYTNATNILTGTLDETRLPYRMDQNLTTSNNVTFANIALTGGTISTSPQYGTDIVNKTYADAIATGVNFHPAVRLATTTGSLFTNVTYYNGLSSNGVGATLTKTSGFTTLSIDGTSTAYNNRILIKDSANSVWNGVYVVSNTGSGSYGWVLTRSYDYDQIGAGTNEIDKGDLIYVTDGSTGAGTSWVQNSEVSAIGTDPITFVQFSSKALYSLSAGDGVYYSVGGSFDGSAASTLAVNTTYIATLAANNASYLGTVAAASYLTNTGAYTISGVHTHTANLILSAGLSANGSYGSAGYVLTSNGTTGAPYWSSGFTASSLTANSISITTGTLSVGNSTVNTDIGNNYISVGNNTSYVNLYSGYITVGNHGATVGVGGTYINTSRIAIGNSTANVYLNSATQQLYAQNSGGTVWSITPATGFAGQGITIGSTFVANATQVTISNIPLFANGSTGTAGQILASNGTTGAPYWTTGLSNLSLTALVSNTISITTGTLTVGNSTVNTDIGNNYISVGNNAGYVNVYSSYLYIGNSAANATINSTVYTGTANNANYIKANTGLVSNATGVYVNATYIGTLSANNTTYVNGKTEANLNVNNSVTSNTANTATYIIANTGLVSNATGVYVNATYINTISANAATYLNGKTEGNLNVNSAVNANSANNASYLGTVAAANYLTNTGTYTISGVHTHSANLALSAGLLANGSVGTAGYVLTSNGTTGSPYWSAGLTANSLTANSIAITTGTLTVGNSTVNTDIGNNYISVGNNLSYVNIYSTYVYFGNSAANATINSTVYTGAANNASYLGTVAAASYLTNTGTYTISGVHTHTANLVLSAGLSGNGSYGTAGQVLTSNGTTGAPYWATVSGGGVNSAAQYTWTNTQTFQANVTFSGNGIGITSNTGAIYLGGISDTNWKIGRNTGVVTKWRYTNNTIDIVTANSNLEGFSIGLVSNNSYFETGYLGTYIASNVTIGNTSSNVTINSTAFSGTSNNTTYLNGQLASYYTNATNISTGTLPYAQLGANVVNTSASFTITGVHTHSANVVLSAGLSANGGYGTSGQVLTSNGTTGSPYWATVTSGGGFTNGQSISVANLAITGSLTANGSVGTAGYVLTSNGSTGSPYWAASLTAVRQQYTGDGSTTIFTVTGGYSPNNLDVFVNGVKVRNGTDVTVTSGSTFSFTVAPPNGALIDVVGSATTSAAAAADFSPTFLLMGA